MNADSADSSKDADSMDPEADKEAQTAGQREKLRIMDEQERESARILSEPAAHFSRKERDAAINSLAQAPDDELMKILSEKDDGDADDPLQTEDDGE